ncbi:MAG TPA: hypothetical protein PKE40_10365 [Arachnia sp.]|nr:hypothetical protein [Arachnia sp.]HMT86746.1 hypothetical protein [Arachnia sp.]
MKVVSRMRAGGLELLIGGLFTVVALVNVRRVAWEVTATELLAFVAVVIALRWLRFGVAMAILVTLLVPFLDPGFYGLSLYVCLLPALTAIRRDRFSLAIVLSVISFGVGVWAQIWSLDAGARPEQLGMAILGWTVVQLIVWASGLAIRSADRAAAERVEARFRAQQAALAAELHNSVCKDLALLSRDADLALEKGSAERDDLERIASRAKIANQALREATRLLASDGVVASAEPITIREALAAGARELRRAGFRVEDVQQGPLEFPPDLDLVAGRILAEALHNVRKHGSTRGPCLVVIEQTPESLDVAVINATDGREGQWRDAGLGLPGMQARAAAVGGTVNARRTKDSWVCEASLPLRTAAAS